MNKAIIFINKIFNNRVLEILLLAAILFLPVSLFVNNLLFTVFFVAFNLKLLFSQRSPFFNSIKTNLFSIIVFCIPLFLAVIGSIYSENLAAAQKDIGRLLPLLLTIPLVFHTPDFFHKILNRILYALTVGCLISAGICWGITFSDIIANNDSVTELFSQKYSNHFLSEKVGIHTPYLGIFVSTSIFFLVVKTFETTKRKRKLLYCLSATILFLFLLNLLARTALFTVIIGGFIYFLTKKRYILFFSSVLMLSIIGGIIYYQNHNYLRDRIFKSINIFEEQTIFSKKDNRFARFDASIEVFKKFPLIGPGTASENKYRKEVYFNNRDSEAYNGNYNAHNQFLEYLSTYGIFGAMAYILLLFTLIKSAYKSQSYVSYFLVFSFIMAGLTESIIERSWGISFYILVLFCVLSFKNVRHETH